MAALHDELIIAVKSLRAFLIRKIWSTASIEKNNQVVDAFDANFLLKLIQDDSEHVETWQYFMSFYAQKDHRYFNHTEQKSIYALIRHLKEIIDGQAIDTILIKNAFQELKLEPITEHDLQQLRAVHSPAPETSIENEIQPVEAVPAEQPLIQSTDITLPADALQKLILDINANNALPKDAYSIIQPFESVLQSHYQDAPSFIQAPTDHDKIVALIKITDFFVISNQTNNYAQADTFDSALKYRYMLLAQKNFYDAVERLKNSQKQDTKYLKDVNDIVSATNSQLIFTPSDALKTQLTAFTEQQTVDNASVVLSQIHAELTTLEIIQEKPETIINDEPSVTDTISTEPSLQVITSAKKHPYYLEGSLEPTMKESPQYDDDLIQELKESFREEAEEEIFPLIESASAVLKNQPYQESDILDLRRAYHTLKGSGYTASMPIIGEIGWQVERVINGVRDNHYPFSEAILYHALDGYDAAKARLSNPEIQDNELQRLTYQAQYLIDHKGVIEPSEITVETTSAPAVIEPNIEVEVTHHYQAFDEMPDDYVSPYHLHGSALPVESEVASLDEDLVAELRNSMFEEAKRELLPELNRVSINLLNDSASHSDLERTRRVFHTLKGNALMIGLNTLGEVAGTIENILDAIISGRYKLTPAITAHIADVYINLKKYLNNINISDEERNRLLYQGNMLKEHKGNITEFLSSPKTKEADSIVDPAQTTPAQPSVEDILSERRQAMFENIQSVIEQSELSNLDQKLTDEILELTDEELSQRLITGFTKCESRTYSALKRYSQDISLCLLHPNFSNSQPLHNLLISAYHKHLLLFRAHGLTPQDARLILWGKVLTAVLAIIKVNQINESIAYEYIEELQKPILEVEHKEVKAQTNSENTQEEVDPELMQAFLEEAHEVLEQADELIQQWQEENYNPQSDKISELRRQMHTLKGGARMVGKDGLGQLSHALESLLDPNYITLFDSDPKRFEVLQRALDHLQVLLESDSKQLDHEGFNLLSALHLLLGNENPPELTKEGAVTGQSTTTEVTDKTATAAQSELSSLKISPTQLNRISEKVSENNILTTQYNNSMSNVIGILAEIARTTQHINMTARNIEIETEAQMISRHAKASQNKEEFDPLELDQFSELQHLARSISESIEDLNTFHKHISEHMEVMSTSLSKFSGNQNLISDTLTDIGTVSFNQILPRLRRIVRQISKANNKQIELIAIGTDTQVERVVLEQMTAAFDHMIRNSIIHGIESPEERIAAGKPEHGIISLKVSKRGSDLNIELSDDGKGFNIEKIRIKAIEKGLIEADTIIDDTELVNLIMLPGFTTATQLSQDAGRGVGLDVLAKAMTILKGTASLSFVPNSGVTFKISIPSTLMIVQSLIVNAGGQNYAIPIDNIIGVTQEKDVIFDGKRTQFSYHNHIYEAYDLAKIYSDIDADVQEQSYIYLLFEVNGKSIAIGAESILSQLEVIMYPLNPQIANIPGLTGSAVTPGGETIFTVDIAAFSQTMIKASRKHSTEKAITEAKALADHTHDELAKILVVDDSITMRRVSQRMLERAGYQVTTAKDGMDALETLETLQPDLIMLDIEMPRMDGFEVLTYLRSTERFLQTPVMMVTSRSGEKHRNRAFEIGANEYCGKPYQEEQILQTIKKLLDKED
ncbi:Hpt domain-containing protein [Wohlfahrtiimonas larvae]|uniref:histidine kinase n=3 Tax=Wohlfahrtiimonas larvae TaxID=1157986 RepID=A0ABP9ME78_9GAMM